MNLIEKLGLEKCKAIVEGAPTGATDFVLWTGKIRYLNSEINEIYSESSREWFSANIMVLSLMTRLADLRTAIAKFECDHDWEDITCNGDLERQLICTYCSMKKSVPFELNAKQWTDEDTGHCTDIRNHISPLTGVIER